MPSWETDKRWPGVAGRAEKYDAKRLGQVAVRAEKYNANLSYTIASSCICSISGYALVCVVGRGCHLKTPNRSNKTRAQHHQKEQARGISSSPWPKLFALSLIVQTCQASDCATSAFARLLISHVVSRRVVSRRVASRRVASCRVASCLVASCRVA